nr:zinc ribbon domain-containing protein [Actinomycetota bacterium]
MTAQCPNGHTSSTDDFCDVCGEPISAAPVGGSASGPGADRPAASPAASSLTLDSPTTSAPLQACPHCGVENLPDALFCEGCGYDFTTGQLPTAAAPAPAASQPTTLTGAAWVAELWVDPD